MNTTATSNRKRALAAAVALVALTGVAIGYVRFTADREGDKARAAATESGLPEVATSVPTASVPSASTEDEATPPAILTINRSPGDHYQTIARLDPTGSVTPLGDLHCERIAAGGTVGACLVPTPLQDPGALGVGLESTELIFFDLTTGAKASSYPVAGRPSRMRMSADGRYAGYTTFVTGHSYAVASSLFSTNPVIVDVLSGVHRNLETFSFTDAEGALIDDPTRNFWGITFAPNDSDTFYAALGIGETNWIVRGSVTGQSGQIIAEGLMCPSASPDGRYLVTRDQSRDSRYTILDLETGERRPVTEDQVVDDQVEWIDNHTIAYAVARDDSPANQPVYDLWTLDIETGERTQLAVAANSPATLRPTP